MKIDLHVHTSERSRCGRSPEKEQIEAAIAAGLDAIVITDHNVLMDDEHLREINEQYAPFKIFGAVELTCVNNGCTDDVIVIGPRKPELLDEIYRQDYPLLHAYVKSQGGFLMLCHPFRYQDFVSIDVLGFRPDAIEVRSVNIAPSTHKTIDKFVKKHKFKTYTNSDSHHYLNLGTFYNNIPSCKDERELAEVLKK